MMNRKKLTNDLEYIENQLIWMRQNPANDLWQNKLITSMLEIQHDILTEIIKSKS